MGDIELQHLPFLKELEDSVVHILLKVDSLPRYEIVDLPCNDIEISDIRETREILFKLADKVY